MHEWIVATKTKNKKKVFFPRRLYNPSLDFDLIGFSSQEIVSFFHSLSLSLSLSLLALNDRLQPLNISLEPSLLVVVVKF